ncbi:MAG: C40 family peptidase [Parachlamydiaceae bacterium]|nr:C40 family peptidase [Parachlamydiaceae bacterium]
MNVNSSAENLYYIVNESNFFLRKEPTKCAEIVSQIFFSEHVDLERTFVRQDENQWLFIKTSDGCVGWVPNDVIIISNDPYTSDKRISALKTYIYEKNSLDFSPLNSLPFGCKIKVIDESDPLWDYVTLPDSCRCYILKGEISNSQSLNHKEKLVDLSKKFLNIPYRKGGRCSYGFDCSGFIQLLYRELEIHLPRFAKQQALDERFKEIILEELEPGDLVFFGNTKDDILHVGMSIGKYKFIHVTPLENKPWVRISSLDDLEWSGKQEACFPYRTARQLKEGLSNSEDFDR